MSKIKNRKKIIDLGKNGYPSLDRFLTPIIEKFSYKPEKDFARYLFGIFNGQEIFYYAVNGEMCFTLEEFAKYLDVKIKTVRNKFSLKIKEEALIKGKHYIESRALENSPENRDYLRGVKSSIYVTFLGVWKLLPTFRGEVPINLYDWFGEKLYFLIKSNQLDKGESFLTSVTGEIISQVLGDKKKCYVDSKGYNYSSKGELLIANVLRQLGLGFQYNAPINLPDNLINFLREDYPEEILIEAGWNYHIPYYITADFLLRTEPRTIIEYWGLKNNQAYDAKREIKTFIYNKLNLRLISIEAHEDQNKPVLKKKLLKELKMKNKEE